MSTTAATTVAASRHGRRVVSVTLEGRPVSALHDRDAGAVVATLVGRPVSALDEGSTEVAALAGRATAVRRHGSAVITCRGGRPVVPSLASRAIKAALRAFFSAMDAALEGISRAVSDDSTGGGGLAINVNGTRDM